MKALTLTTQAIPAVLLISLISGCSLQSKPSSVLTQGPTMRDVLANHSGGNRVSAPRSLSWDDGYTKRTKSNTYGSYTRTEQKELNGLFPRLPNPDLCMYVFPHITVEDATVPGYTSCFPMFDKNHYALPGEPSAHQEPVARQQEGQ